MVRRRWWVVGVVCAYAGVLAGCTGAGGGGGGSSSAGVSVSSSRSVTSSVSPSSSSSAGVGGDGRPVAALAHTQAGAEAFLRYFFDQLNVAWTTPDAHALDGLCASGDTICDGYRQVAVDLRSSHWHYESAALTLGSVEFSGGSPPELRAEVLQVQNSGRIVDGVGRTQESVAATTMRLAYYLEWKPAGWRVTRILRVLA